MFFFFFQAEDGIRDYKVTGVQTCALPISAVPDDHLAGAVLLRRNHPLERGVLERMVLDLDRHALVVHVERGTLGNRPGFQHPLELDRKSTRLNSSHLVISYAVFCLKKKKKQYTDTQCQQQ